MELKLPCGKITLIDDEDAERIAGLHWHAAWMSGRYWRVVAMLPRRRRKVYLHRLLLDAPEHLYVDHANGDTLDNRKENLRLCTNAENQQNSGSRRGSSRFKGVSWWARRDKWRVAFNWRGRTYFVGYFDDEENAARAYDAAIRPLAGEFARLNFPCLASEERKLLVSTAPARYIHPTEKLGSLHTELHTGFKDEKPVTRK